jgi:hypothetical protein
MRCSFTIGLCLLLIAGGAFAQQRPEQQPPGRGARARATETPLDRWSRMTPEERQRALAKLTPQRRRELMRKLERFRSLPPEERQQLRERYRAFSQLPPEQQKRARELFRQFNSLPEDRRPVVRREYEELRSMPAAGRETRMNSEAFRSRFTAPEQQMLQDLTRVFGSPP